MVGRALYRARPYSLESKGRSYAAEGSAGGSKEQGYKLRHGRGSLLVQRRAGLADGETPGGVAELRATSDADTAGRGLALHGHLGRAYRGLPPLRPQPGRG